MIYYFVFYWHLYKGGLLVGFFHGNAFFLHERLYPLSLTDAPQIVSHCECTYMTLFKTGDLSSPFCNTSKGYCTVLPCVQHTGSYAVCPLHFSFSSLLFGMRLLVTMWFLKCFASASSKVVFSCVSSKFCLSISIWPLCVFCCLRDGQISVKCSACSTFKPGARRAQPCQLQRCFRGCTQSEVAFPGAGVLAPLTAQTKASGWCAGARSLKKSTPKDYFSDL